MARSARIDLPWADDTYSFRLGWSQISELQEKCDAGPYVILDRLTDKYRVPRNGEILLGADGSFPTDKDGELMPESGALRYPSECRQEDVSNVIRLGLIGGGMSPVDALKKIKTYVEERPLEENKAYAYAILAAALYGAPEERVGEAAGEVEAKEPMTSPEEKSE